jgi:hypothetical protein
MKQVSGLIGNPEKLTAGQPSFRGLLGITRASAIGRGARQRFLGPTSKAQLAFLAKAQRDVRMRTFLQSQIFFPLTFISIFFVMVSILTKIRLLYFGINLKSSILVNVTAEVQILYKNSNMITNIKIQVIWHRCKRKGLTA